MIKMKCHRDVNMMFLSQIYFLYKLKKKLINIFFFIIISTCLQNPNIYHKDVITTSYFTDK